MNLPTSPRRRAPQVWLALAALSCLFAKTGVADPPVITNPGDLHYLDVNTAFNPVDSSWSIVAPMPTARSAFAIAAANDGMSDKIFVIGGTNLNDCTTISPNQAYDPVLDMWTIGLPELPYPARRRPSAGTLDNIIYLLGGALREGDIGCAGGALATNQSYNPLTMLWTSLTDMPTARLQVGVGVDPVNHLLYAVGGLISTFGGDIPLDTVEVYDPYTDTWATRQHLNTPRGLAAIAVVGGYVYAVGGQANNLPVTSVEKYDPVLDTWTPQLSVEPMPARLDPATAVLNSKVYVVGGNEIVKHDRVLSTVQVYDPASDTWAELPPMPSGRSVLGAAALNNNIYAIGGEAPIGTVGQEFTYQITATSDPGDPITSYDASPLPVGLIVDQTRGIITGIPQMVAGNFIVNFSATTASGATSSKPVSFYFAATGSSGPDAPSIISSPCATGRGTGTGQFFTYQVLANNASSAAQFAATGLPYQQLTIDPLTGLISGSVPPTADGSPQSFGIEIGLTDGLTSTQSYLELTFVSDPAVPVITSSSSVRLVLNQYFFYQIATDATASSLDYIGLNRQLDGKLPAGLVFDGSAGTISGIFGRSTAGNAPARKALARNNTDSNPTGYDTETIDTIKKEPPPHIQLLAGNDLGGTGTAPLNFILGLHDDEVETLTTQTSDGTPYVVFTDDPFTSGGAAGLLESSNIGQFVTYTVPVTVSGTYDVKVGTKTNTNEGMFQLAIDGINQGLPQDEYSPSVGYPVKDLGPVTFDSSGPHSFQFTVTGRNAQSSDYQLVLDYLDLVPYLEAEALEVQESNVPYVLLHDPNLSGGAGILLKATNTGDFITYIVPVAVAGSYDVSVGTKTNPKEGVFQLLVDGLPQGYPRDEYRPRGSYDLRDLGTVKLTTPGPHTFQFIVAGQDPRSSGYELAFDYIDLVLSTHLEAETLLAHGTAPLVPVEDSTMSNQAGTLFRAKGAGDSVFYKVNIAIPGTYDIKLGTRTGSKSGIFQLSVDGITQASADEYSGKVGYEVLDLGRIEFPEAGNKVFEFQVTGHNAKSRGYQLSFDYFDLVR